MSDKMNKFSSIEQFRNVIRNVEHKASFKGLDENGDPIYDKTATKPVLTFEGTVKIHGTNAGICYHKDGSFEYYSRERVLSTSSDNAQFMTIMSGKEDFLRPIFQKYAKSAQRIIIYGEWCGGSIQRNVAVCGLPVMFVMFAVKIVHDDGFEFWLNQPLKEVLKDFVSPENKLYSIFDFPTYSVNIDFNCPQLSQNTMIELTEAVEAECPVGKAFGKEGIGEGIVWRCTDDDYNNSGFWFKVKGEKHSVSKVKTLAAVDVELIKTTEEFLDNVVTENRLHQGIHVLQNELLKPLDRTSTGDFVRWVYNDIVKEEIDTIEANGLDSRKLGGAISNRAKVWFFKHIGL